MPCSMAVFISGESVLDVDGLACTDTDLGEARHQLGLGRIGRAELQDEIQDVEELERFPLVLGRKRLDEVDCRRGGRRGLAEECR